MEKARQRYKFDHDLMYIATRNAVGGLFSKNYKYEDVFGKENQKKEVTDEEREQMKKYLESW